MILQMQEKELQDIIQVLRDFTLKERQEKPTDKVSVFFINVIEIACNLSELAILQGRSITEEEEYWFGGSYHMNFWNPEIESNFYSVLTENIKKRNYFR